MTEISPWHVLILLIVCIFGGLFMTSGWMVAGWVAFGITGVCCLWFAFASCVDSLKSFVYELREFLDAFTRADPEARDAVKLMFPALRLDLTNGPIVTVSDSGVRLVYFREFLNGSNPLTIVPESKYKDGSIKRNQWYLWRAWLLDKGLIYETRIQMNKSWHWKSEEDYWRLVSDYIKMRIPPELLPESTRLPDGLTALPGMNIGDELR
jgi:hypothetical protein